MKERYTVNPFPELALTDVDRDSLEDLANTYIMTNLDLCQKFLKNGRKVDPRRWKPLKGKKGLMIYSERPESVGTAGPDEATGAGLPTILCTGTKEGKLDDLMFGIISEDLETMRVKASYADSFSAAAVLDGVVMPSLEDPFRSLVVKWMELDIPFKSTGNISFIAYWRQIDSNTMEMYGTGIIDPRDDGLIRKLSLSVVANLWLGSLDYAYCGQMRKLTSMLERRYAESKTRGAPNKDSCCVTCSAPNSGRRIGDFGKSKGTCKLCFGFVCHACKVDRKLTFVDPDLQMTQRKVTFCTACISEVTSLPALDMARAKLLSVQRGDGGNWSGTTGYASSSNMSDTSFRSQ